MPCSKVNVEFSFFMHIEKSCDHKENLLGWKGNFEQYQVSWDASGYCSLL
jgi:hypothetical protein